VGLYLGSWVCVYGCVCGLGLWVYGFGFVFIDLWVGFVGLCLWLGLWFRIAHGFVGWLYFMVYGTCFMGFGLRMGICLQGINGLGLMFMGLC
jgi:hypothetical protein